MKHGLLYTLGLIVLIMVVFATSPTEAQRIDPLQHRPQMVEQAPSQLQQVQPQQLRQQTVAPAPSRVQQDQAQQQIQKVQVPPAPLTPAPMIPAQVTPVKEPIQISLLITIKSGYESGYNTFTVPQGKRLVIEYASAHMYAPKGQECAFSIYTVLKAATYSIQHYLIAKPLARGAFELFHAGQIVKLYADSGTTVRLEASRGVKGGEVLGRFSISGYTVNLQ